MRENAVPTAIDMETVQMLLREPKNYQDNFDLLRNHIRIALGWYERMVSVSRDCGVPLGFLCRLVLPFDSNTDARDQSNVKCTIINSSDSVSAHAVSELREGAIFVRKMLRVKLADEADMRQVRDAITMITTLVANPKNN